MVPCDTLSYHVTRYYQWLVACPVCSFSLEIMPRTRPSTRIQRRAEPTAARPRSTRSQQPMVQDPGLVPPVSATPPEDVPMAPTAPGTTPPGLSDSTIARITSAVTRLLWSLCRCLSTILCHCRWNLTRGRYHCHPQI